MTTITINTSALTTLEDQLTKLRRKVRSMRAGINNLKAAHTDRAKWRKAVAGHIERFASLGIVRPAIVALHLNSYAVPKFYSLAPWTGDDVAQFNYRNKKITNDR